MKLNLKNPIVFFDLETTGTNINTDRIVEICYLKVYPNGNEEAKTLRINPEMHIPAEASAVHGIYDEDVADCPTFKEVARGIYVGANLDGIVEYINTNGNTEGCLRFFLGYSGWTEGQLTSEILRNTWALNPHPGSADLLTGSGDLFWRREVERMGAKYKSWLIVPSNPSFN